MMFCLSFFAQFYFFKSESVHPNPLAVSDALAVVALHFFRSRLYKESLDILTEVLQLRIQALGDADSPNPHPRVADVYANIGLVQRLLGKPYL